MADVRERPILFSAPMVRALLDGRKSQTRRIAKPQPPSDCQSVYRPFHTEPNNWQGVCARDLIGWYGRCPYGVPGDRLWVRETWAQNENQTSDTHMDRTIVYAADDCGRALDNGGEKPWRPSIFMPRRASRITLEVVDVRVERLQDITEADAIAEGITGPHDVGYRAFRLPDDSKPRYSRAEAAYEELWNSINGADSWAANPWVWVLSFSRIANE